jgi:hypothetical protein
MAIRIDILIGICVRRGFPDFWVLSRDDYVISAHVRFAEHWRGQQGLQFCRNPDAETWTVALLYRGAPYFADRVRSADVLAILKAR